MAFQDTTLGSALKHNARFITGDRKGEGIWLCTEAVKLLNRWEATTKKDQEFLDSCRQQNGGNCPCFERHPDANERRTRCRHCKSQKLCTFMRLASFLVEDLQGEQPQDLAEPWPVQQLQEPMDLELVVAEQLPTPEEEQPPQPLQWHQPLELPDPFAVPEPLEWVPELLVAPATPESLELLATPEPMDVPWSLPFESWLPEEPSAGPQVLWQPNWRDLECIQELEAQRLRGWSLTQPEEDWWGLEERAMDPFSSE